MMQSSSLTSAGTSHMLKEAARQLPCCVGLEQLVLWELHIVTFESTCSGSSALVVTMHLAVAVS